MYCGIDLANKTSAICVVDQQGKLLLETECCTDEDGFQQALAEFELSLIHISEPTRPT